MIQCSLCKEFRPDSSFRPRADGSRKKVKSACRECENRKNLERYHTRYEDMLSDQGGVCFVCGDAPPRLTIDHCHATGKIRALLCNGCNAAIGLAKEDPDRLRALAVYVEAHGV